MAKLNYLINHKDNTITLNNKIYRLEDIRDYLITNYQTLCKQHFIKCIVQNKKQLFTYDWQSIIDIAKECQYFSESISVFSKIKPVDGIIETMAKELVAVKTDRNEYKFLYDTTRGLVVSLKEQLKFAKIELALLKESQAQKINSTQMTLFSKN